MTRPRLLGLLAVLALVVGAVLIGTRGGGPAGSDPALVALQDKAALGPCPAGLGPGLPAATLGCLGGGPAVPLRSPSGRPTVVNVWATWCPPCVQEVPAFVDLAARSKGRLDVVGVLTVDTADSALTFAQQFGMHYPSLLDPDGVVRAQYGGGTPITLLLDATGKVVYTQVGAVRSAQALRDLVDQHLAIRV